MHKNVTVYVQNAQKDKLLLYKRSKCVLFEKILLKTFPKSATISL